MPLLNEQDLRRAVELAIAPLLYRIDALSDQVAELEQKLDGGEPELAIAPHKEACKLLGMGSRTLQRHRKSWIEGVHWWREEISDRPLYNLALIRDGQRQGFDSPSHLKACQQWVKARSSNRKRVG